MRKMNFVAVSLICFVSFLFSTGKVQAKDYWGEEVRDYQLIEIISEPEDNLVHNIVLNLKDNGDIDQIIRKSKSDQTVFTPADILRKEVVLARASDRDAVLIGCQNCGSEYGGVVTLRYLNNGVTNSYKTFDIELAREGDEWGMYTVGAEQRVKINRLRLISRKVGGMLIGIRKIEVNI